MMVIKRVISKPIKIVGSASKAISGLIKLKNSKISPYLNIGRVHYIERTNHRLAPVVGYHL